MHATHNIFVDKRMTYYEWDLTNVFERIRKNEIREVSTHIVFEYLFLFSFSAIHFGNFLCNINLLIVFGSKS